MILYAIPVSTYSAKVRIALGIKNIDYEMVPPPGGHSSPEYKTILPVGTIPGLKDGDFVTSESEVITDPVVGQITDESRQATLQWMGAG